VPLLLLVFFLQLPAPAQQGQDAAGKQAAQDYVLGPGDEIMLHVIDLDEIPEKPVRIDPSGYLDLPLAGRVEASGLTLEQLKASLAVKLAKYITSPQISVNLTDNQSRLVSVIGSVNSPGVHQLQGPRRLIEVISLAGGVRQDAGSRVIITRQAKWGTLPLPGVKVDGTEGFSTATLSLDSLLAANQPAQNILIMPNDVISIPKADLVYVVGDVKKAGGFQMASHDTMSVLQALSLSEGFGPSASPKSSKIMRPIANDPKKMDEIPVDIQKIFAGKAPDVALYANDVLFIPNSMAKSSARRVAEAVLQAATTVAIYAH
jgi:polysaccharide export outer membrane protein